MIGSRHRWLPRLLKRQLRNSVNALTGRVLAPPKWVFVLGCYNSGTTLLANILAQHPALNALPREGVELTDRLARPEQFGWPRMWNNCLSQIEPPVLSAAAADEERAARIKKQWSHFVSDDASILEKSPPNIVRAPFLQAHFQPAYFIYIVRNGYAVAEGIRRKAQPAQWGNKSVQEYSIEECAAQWVASDAMMSAHAPALHNHMTVTYEDLTRDVSGSLQLIARFLAIEPFAEDLAASEVEVHRQATRISNMNAQSFEHLSEDERTRIHAIAHETLDKYGYSVLRESSVLP